MVVTGSSSSQRHLLNYGIINSKSLQREKDVRAALDGPCGSSKSLGAHHPGTLDQLAQLGNALLAQGRLTEAELALTSCWEGRRATLGESHPQTHRALREMAEVRRRCGYRSAAQEVLHRSQCHGLDTRHPISSVPHAVSLRSIGVALKAGKRLTSLERELAGSKRPGSTPLWKSKSTSALAKAKLKAKAKAAISLGPPKGIGRRLDPEAAAAVLRQFAVLIMTKYGDVKKAFHAFDINGNGTLSGSEFASYAKLIYEGDVTAVFKALDVDHLGDISVKEFDILRKMYHEMKKSGELDITIKPDERVRPQSRQTDARMEDHSIIPSRDQGQHISVDFDDDGHCEKPLMSD